MQMQTAFFKLIQLKKLFVPILLLLAFSESNAQHKSMSVTSIAALKGQYLPAFIDSIFIGHSILVNGGGYMLKADTAFQQLQYSISYWSGEKNIYRLFIRSLLVNGVRKQMVKDVLTIPKAALKGHSLVEQSCYAGNWDEEVIALVKDVKGNPEYFYQIKKAWRANRKTGTFEKLDPARVKKCGNESYGI